METFRVRCPACRSVLRVALKHAGMQKHCPHPDCGHAITLPTLTQLQQHQAAKQAQKPLSKQPVQREATRSSSQPDPVLLAQTTPKPQTPAKKFSYWSGLVGSILIAVVGLAIGFALPSGNTGGVSVQEVSLQANAVAPVETFDQKVKPFFAKYCNDCHGSDVQEGGVQLDLYGDNTDLLGEYAVWQKIHQQISVGSMPPQDSDMPSDEERSQVAGWLDQKLHHFDCQQINNPGRVTVRRLNRTEYDNTIRDLLGVELQLSKNFPTDDVGYGFDNIGDVLSVSPLLMERYLDAAETVSEAVITLPETLKLDRRWLPGDMETKGAGSIQPDTLSIVSSGMGIVKFDVKVPGPHQFRLEASATQGGTELAKCLIRVNGKDVITHEVPGHRTKKMFEWTTDLQAGPHEVQLVFTNDFYDPKAEDPKMRDRNLYLHNLSLASQIPLESKHFPEAHQKFVTTWPGENQTALESAKKLFTSFLPRAYRRPVSAAELERVLAYFQIAQDRGENYERSLQIALQGVLIAPQFLFRLETPAQADSSVEVQTLQDYELASRLSYFLWSSMPDKTLFELAEKGLLRTPQVLEEQTRRMLKDPKSAAFVSNFVGQWLGLRKLSEAEPDRELYPEFTDQLVAAMPQETEMLFAEVLQNNRSVMDLLTADYTFVNETLAKLYGLEGVQGDEFRRVELKQVPRRGLMSHAGILTLTSFPNRTSPVKRGEWVLENILAQAPPPAPASVPGLEETQQANPNLTFREQLTLHLSDSVCRSCHILMDGIGFGLENYDAIGRWRTHEAGQLLDTKGDLPDGSSFEGPVSLIQILGGRPEQFTRSVSEKMLTYALGRGLEWYDKCAVDDIIASTRADDYRLSRVVVEIVLSPPFRSQRLDD